eukprot:c20501_g2_i6.p1 GENE.c20501_g2_i6~~c20501_g2_i6.p1  ORF type:complete len:701 (+),score=186.09 c20501_g2_i6:110-2212(+)
MLDVSENFVTSVPSQIGLLSGLQYLLLRQNKLSGTLPDLTRLTRLIVLDLSGNSFDGGLPGWVWHANSLEYLLLHQNKLSGSISSQIALLTNLTVLSLYGNQLGGSLPRLYQAPNSLTLLFRNRLSCPLPSHTSDNSPANPANARTLIALGNLFRLVGYSRTGAEEWLFSWDEDSTHLFVGFPAPWARLLIMVGAVLVLTGLWGFVQKKGGVGFVGFGQPSLLWRRCIKICIVAVGFGVVQAIGLFNSHTVHECADAVSRMSLSEQTNLSAGLCGWVWTTCALCCGMSAFGAVWLLRQFSGNKHHARLLAEESETTQTMVAKPRVLWRIGLFLGWGLLMCGLSVPAFLNLAVSSLPANNSLGVHGVVATLLQFCVSPLLVLATDILIPKSCVWFVSQYTGEKLRWQHRQTTTARGPDPHVDADATPPTDTKDEASVANTSRTVVESVEDEMNGPTPPHPATIELMLVSQLAVLVVLPVLARLLFDEHCMGIGRMMWSLCDSTQVTFGVSLNVSISTHGSSLRQVAIPVLAPDAVWNSVCEVSWSINDSDMCVRKVIGGSASLVLSKVVVQTLLTMARSLIGALLGWLGWRGVFWDVFRRACQNLDEVALARSVVSLMLLGFAFGATAPLVWIGVLFALGSIQLLRASVLASSSPEGQAMRAVSSSRRVVDGLGVPRMVLAGPVIQLVILGWFAAKAGLCV